MSHHIDVVTQRLDTMSMNTMYLIYHPSSRGWAPRVLPSLFICVQCNLSVLANVYFFYDEFVGISLLPLKIFS